MKSAQYLFENILLFSFVTAFKVLPPKAASWLGGALGRILGALILNTKQAHDNIKMCLPQANTKKILSSMLENSGRLFAEYPHLEKIARGCTEIENIQFFEKLKAAQKPVIFISGHVANWEVAAATLCVNGLTIGLMYRAPNNPYADKLLNKFRSLNGAIETFPKSRQGTRDFVKCLREGHSVGILIDQKYNEGVNVPFFGHPAMTSPAFVQLARKFDCPVVPVQVRRLEGCHFRVTFHEALDMSQTDDKVMLQAHNYLEGWIKQAPGQWIWMHKRWKQT